MSTRLGDLVESLGGELIGDPDIAVIGIAPLDAATASHITFLSNPKLRAQASATLQGLWFCRRQIIRWSLRPTRVCAFSVLIRMPGLLALRNSLRQRRPSQ